MIDTSLPSSKRRMFVERKDTARSDAVERRMTFSNDSNGVKRQIVDLYSCATVIVEDSLVMLSTKNS